MLDIGLPLSPPTEGLTKYIEKIQNTLDKGIDAIILSHYHQDHWGLIPKLEIRDTPVYISEGASKVMDASALFTGARLPKNNIKTYKNDETMVVGDIEVRFEINDHSAYEAYSLIVSDGVHRLFYSGDFRDHGRKSWAIDRLARLNLGEIDLLMVEGTNMGSSKSTKTENMLEEKFVNEFKSRKGLGLVCYSPQNIDRFCTIFRAAIRAKKTYIADFYQAMVLEAIDRPTIPKPSTSALRVFLSAGQKRSVIREKRFKDIEQFKSQRIYQEELASSDNDMIMIFRGSMIPDLQGLNPSYLVYSQWSGYLNRDNILKKWCSDNNIEVLKIHTSGHTDLAGIQKLVGILKPKTIVPIHGVNPRAFSSLFSNVSLLEDSKTYDVGDIILNH